MRTNGQKRRPKALKLTADSLKKLNIVDDIIPEPLGGAHRNATETAGNLERYISRTIRQLSRIPPEELLSQRYARWRKLGSVIYLQPMTSEKQYIPATTSENQLDS